ncbi:hypothetical protein TVAG_237310 [Trichomonas vaginalis G3]|uniref:Uncharacterized protein n=1 Tax=Trichomonas vaginalis (strain ATCC PRA-98 / G3) TaxID=412133 RepID=A2DCT1_TRIV3|nr:hypothetical protein TVAGG3_0606960 [Trichomonas vaginalis G3]EAY21705.1 hypothetical protein TVAG_237310 [Trichomonas vaginalis G3]KAI5524316.1 hypothetical protein TVAGG3_0606960 [Trichomonas vaginalis G3]|eukprot:XP_001582691.1 hypothetical protein [Trichomonas vaginalis G3]
MNFDFELKIIAVFKNCIYLTISFKNCSIVYKKQTLITEDSDSDDIFLDVVKKLKVYNTGAQKPTATSKSCPTKTKNRNYQCEPYYSERGLPQLQHGFQVSGTKVLPESLAFIQPTHLDDFKAKERDYKTLPVDHRSASKFSHFDRKPRRYFCNGTPSITKKFIETQKKEYEQLEKENDAYRNSGIIPQWASVGVNTTCAVYGNKKKVQVRSKYAKVMAL